MYTKIGKRWKSKLHPISRTWSPSTSSLDLQNSSRCEAWNPMEPARWADWVEPMEPMEATFREIEHDRTHKWTINERWLRWHIVIIVLLLSNWECPACPSCPKRSSQEGPDGKFCTVAICLGSAHINNTSLKQRPVTKQPTHLVILRHWTSYFQRRQFEPCPIDVQQARVWKTKMMKYANSSNWHANHIRDSNTKKELSIDWAVHTPQEPNWLPPLSTFIGCAPALSCSTVSTSCPKPSSWHRHSTSLKQVLCHENFNTSKRET